MAAVVSTWSEERFVHASTSGCSFPSHLKALRQCAFVPGNGLCLVQSDVPLTLLARALREYTHTRLPRPGTGRLHSPRTGPVISAGERAPRRLGLPVPLRGPRAIATCRSPLDLKSPVARGCKVALSWASPRIVGAHDLRPPAEVVGNTQSLGGNYTPWTGVLSVYRLPQLVPGYGGVHSLHDGHSHVTSMTPTTRNTWGGAQDTAHQWVGDLQRGRTHHPCHWP